MNVILFQYVYIGARRMADSAALLVVDEVLLH